MTAAQVESSEIDLFSHETISDPYLVYAELRKTVDVVWMHKRQLWAVVGYGAARTVLGD